MSWLLFARYAAVSCSTLPTNCSTTSSVLTLTSSGRSRSATENQVFYLVLGGGQRAFIERA